ncbi:MAG TPA: sigma-70 family RNA polymerase sigma factor [Prolixibacteraceae bacterium]
MDDKELVNRVLRGETQIFAIIIKNTEGLVAQIVFKLLSNPEDRKDIAQDIYLKAYKNLPGFKFQSKLSTWIGQIAFNTCFNFLEKKKLILLDNNTPESENSNSKLELAANKLINIFSNETENKLFRTELAGIVHSASELLTPLHKTLITLYHYEELSYEEIAEITALPIGTVKNYLFRARRALKDNILLHYKLEEL